VGVRRGAAALLLSAAFAARAAGENVYRLPVGDPARRDREAPVVLDAVTDTAGGGLWTPAELPKRLEGVRLLLVGESHTDMDSHRIEKRVLEELVRAGRKAWVGVEMYPYTAQAALDEWTAGKLSEEAFLDASRWYKNWGYNWLYYRDIFLFARDNRLPLIAINAPREVVSAVRRKGFQGLNPEEAAHVPTDIDSKNADHLRLFKASFGEESFHAGMDDAAWQSMLDAQCTWDATMGFHAIQPLRGNDDPRAIVVVLVGAGHVQYGLGIERQVKRWFPGKVASLIPVPVWEEKTGPVKAVQASYASFVWGAPPENDPLYPELGIATRVRDEEKLLEILDVERRSPAAAAGLKARDVLLTLDGAAVPDKEALAKAMAGKRWGDAAALSVLREGAQVSVPVLLRREPPAPR
jgi:aminopeptidase N